MARLFPMVSAETKVRNFTSNSTWTASLTTTSLISANGKGAAGAAAYDDTSTDYYIYKYRFYAYRHSDNTYTYSSETLVSATVGSVKPGDYCEDPGEYWAQIGTDIEWRFTCYRHEKKLVTTGGYHPATTGASATFAAGVSGTSRTFPGGTGGPAPTTTFTNVPVTPGQTYNVVVPAGGSITITYIE